MGGTMRFIGGLLYMMLAVLMATAPAVQAQTRYTPVQTSVSDLMIMSEGTVTEIVKPDLVRLDNDMLFVLDNIRVPALYADAAIAWLEENLLNQAVSVRANAHLGDGAKDRLGNKLGHIVTQNGNLWIQQAMVSAGLAWADGTQTNRDLMVPLLQSEAAARAAQLGFWAAPGMAPRQADAIGVERDAFMVVEGGVVNTADKKAILFANFGDDWKTDFTLYIKKENLSLFPPDKRILLLKDKRVRVRGWVTERNGPTIELTYPEQIEIIDAPASAPPAP